MRIRIYLRTPGKHEEIATFECDDVPRIGESVFIGKDVETYQVHDVTWNLAENEVIVLVK